MFSSIRDSERPIKLSKQVYKQDLISFIDLTFDKRLKGEIAVDIVMIVSYFSPCLETDVIILKLLTKRTSVPELPG